MQRTNGGRPVTERAVSELSPDARAAIRDAARAMASRLDEIHGAVVAATLERVPVDADGSHLVTSLSDMVTANLMAFIATVGGRLEVTAHEPLPEERKWAANLARAGREPSDLLAAHRTIQAELEAQWRRGLREQASDLETFADADAATAQVLFQMVDRVLPELMAHHAATSAADPPVIALRRGSTIRSLLAGHDVDVPEASARLHYELDRWHVALAARVTDDATAEEQLERVVGAVRAATGRRPLATRAGSDVIHVWAGFDGEPERVALPPVTGAVVALGRAARGLDGFRRSRHEAVRALDLAIDLGRAPGTVTDYAEVEVLSLLYADRPQARRFVDEVLGPLIEADATGALVTTMEVLYDEHLNSARAAERLGVHRNTITYRLRKVLELTGASHPLTLRLRVAVALAPAVLSGVPSPLRRGSTER